MEALWPWGSIETRQPGALSMTLSLLVLCIPRRQISSLALILPHCLTSGTVIVTSHYCSIYDVFTSPSRGAYPYPEPARSLAACWPRRLTYPLALYLAASWAPSHQHTTVDETIDTTVISAAPRPLRTARRTACTRNDRTARPAPFQTTPRTSSSNAPRASWRLLDFLAPNVLGHRRCLPLDSRRHAFHPQRRRQGHRQALRPQAVQQDPGRRRRQALRRLPQPPQMDLHRPAGRHCPGRRPRRAHLLAQDG